MLTPREKSPAADKFSPEEDRTHDAAASKTASSTNYQQAIPAPDSGFDSRFRRGDFPDRITPVT